jgi:hypothetical protein
MLKRHCQTIKVFYLRPGRCRNVVLHWLNKGVILRCRMRSKYFLELRVLRFKSWKLVEES